MIQRVGQRCVVCAQRIALASEAAACDSCAALWHTHCARAGVVEGSLQCPHCGLQVQPADSRRVYALVCPRCRMSHHGAPVERCEGCGMTCSWLDDATFRSEMAIRRGWGRDRLINALLLSTCAAAPLWLAFQLLRWLVPIGAVLILPLLVILVGASGWLLLQGWRGVVDFSRSRHAPAVVTL